MKFIVLTKTQIFVLLSIVLIMLGGNLCAALSKKVEKENSESEKENADLARTKRKRALIRTHEDKKEIKKNFTNSSYNISMRTQLERNFNDTGFLAKDSNQFFHDHNSFLANKLLDKQIIEIYNIFRTKKFFATRYDLRGAIEFFLNDFEKCSPNKTYVMDEEQFGKCMIIDPSLRKIISTPERYASYPGYSDPKDVNFTQFKKTIFKSLNKMNEDYLNFYEYLMLRLMAFSWWKCSVNGPYLDESGWECAIDIVSDWRSLDRSTARNIYYLAVKLSPNGEKTRHIDFITFTHLATSIRTFGAINLKEDSEATKAEFNNALDNNILPIRYNQKIIDDLFKLVSEEENPGQGIDVLTFWYFDTLLRLFMDEAQGPRIWHADLARFIKVMKSPYMPQQFIKYIKLIPQYNLTQADYHLEVFNNPRYFRTEEDYLKFPKFLQKEVAGNQLKQALKPAFDESATYGRIFKVLDADEDGFIDFYDFGLFIQILTIFEEADDHNKGRVVAGILLEKFTTSNNLMTLSTKFREKAKRFGIIHQDTYFDVFHSLVIMKMEEIAYHYARRENPTLIFEIELKQILHRIGMVAIPDGKLSSCIRGEGDNELHKYDWECSLMIALKNTLEFIERNDDLVKIKQNKIPLIMNTYVNVDPKLRA